MGSDGAGRSRSHCRETRGLVRDGRQGVGREPESGQETPNPWEAISREIQMGTWSSGHEETPGG